MECRARERPVIASYREFEPHPSLRGRVRALFSFALGVETPPPWRRMLCDFRFGDGDPFSAPMFADGSSSIVFDLGESLHADGRWRRNAGARGSVIGAMSVVDHVHRGELPAMVGAYFRPAQVASFARAPSSELTDRIVAVEDLWGGSAARDLSAELTVLNEAERLDCLETALLERMRDRRESGVAVNVPRLAAWVTQRRGRLSVESLADAAGVSRQRLTRVFREQVGVSPKLYCRLARFQSALVYARRGREVEWARLAVDLGYADQSHMIAEFRQFSTLTPHALSSERWFHPFIERAKAVERGIAPTYAAS